MIRVSVFGGSRTEPGEDDYQQALLLGQLLGKKGCTVLTGGYIGTMEAVSRGVAENGGHVIGVTCDQIEVWRPVKPNRWVQEEQRFETLRQRLYVLVNDCDAALALPGGPGTLTEVAVMWNQLITGALPPRPLILIGAGWQHTFTQFFQAHNKYIPDDQRLWLSFANDVNTAVDMLEDQMNEN